MDARHTKTAAWLRRFGVAGFVFFLVEGLLWLIIPTLYLAWTLR
ncbi:MAG: hypothetical protein ACREQQ_11300 [Candidatus Binatia bacterium]